MRILVLGGTSFAGRAVVEDALRAGAEVTLFGRGKTGAGLFPGLTRLIGDRDTGDYTALGAGRWDAVVDCSGYVPRHVGQAMDALGGRAGRYLFISSHAVYQLDGIGPGSTEDTPRRPPVRDTGYRDARGNTRRDCPPAICITFWIGPAVRRASCRSREWSRDGASALHGGGDGHWRKGQRPRAHN